MEEELLGRPSLSENNYSRIVSEMGAYLGTKGTPEIFKRKCILFASGGNANKINIFSNSLELAYVLNGHKNIIWCLTAISPTMLASGSEDKTIKIWDLGDEKRVIATLITPNEGITCILYHRRLTPALISGSSDKKLIIWNLGELPYAPRYILTGHTSSVYGIINLNEEQVVSGEWAGKLIIWRIEDGTSLIIIKGKGSLSKMKNFGSNLACSNGKSLSIWHMTSGLELLEHNFVKRGWSIELISKGKYIRGLHSGELELVDISSGMIIDSINLFAGTIKDITFIANNIIVIAAQGTGRNVKVFDFISKISYFDYIGHEIWAWVLAKFY